MIELRRPAGGFARVGHRGASALAPENTPAAFELAVELGCDMLEFDVLDRADGTVVVAHDARRARTPGLVTLDEALTFCVERLPDVGLQVDLKRRGVEAAVVDALQRHGVYERSWASSFDAGSLRRLAQIAPELPRSYTLPRDRLGISKRRLFAPVVRSTLASLGTSLPGRLSALLERTTADAFTLHHSVASAEAIAQAHELGAAVYVWTVDDPGLARQLIEAGADGIITNDPRVFSELTT
ncbi:MAG: glycerophosphodiester phosphodiesterase [Gaiellaceae bacterium]